MNFRKYVALLATCGMLLLFRGDAHAQSEVTYVYLGIQDAGNAEIVFIDPHRPDQIMSVQELSIPANQKVPHPVQNAYLSPNGQWVGFFLPSAMRDSTYAFQLVNLLTGEVRDITAPAIIQPFAQWSFDGNYVTFMANDDDDKDIFIYSVATDTTTNLTNDGFDQTDYAWSPTSTQIAAVTLSYPSEGYAANLGIIDVPTGQTRNNISLSNNLQFAALTCELAWSPDERYISFAAACNPDAPSIPNDVYIWDTTLETITPATEFTTPYFGMGGVLDAWYDTYWYDANTLLVGVTHVRTTETNLTLAITFPENQSTTLSHQMAEGWTQNPETGELALRTFTTSGFLPQNPSIEMMRFADDTLVTSATLPVGYDLAWSPDGVFLAFTDRSAAVVGGITVYNAASGEMSEINISGYDRIIPIGWINTPPA